MAAQTCCPASNLFNPDAFGKSCQELIRQDDDLKRLFQNYGQPPLWQREPTFGTIIHIILEQQVSLASAQAAFNRLQASLSQLSPEAFLGLSDEILKTIGFSRQKTRYGRALAEAILGGMLKLERLEHLSDDEVHSELCQVRGIGKWTADIYLLMALGRPDVWPSGDLAIAAAVQRLKGLAQRPDPAALEAIAAAWRPYRSVAARLLWQDYLAARKKNG